MLSVNSIQSSQSPMFNGKPVLRTEIRSRYKGKKTAPAQVRSNISLKAWKVYKLYKGLFDELARIGLKLKK